MGVFTQKHKITKPKAANMKRKGRQSSGSVMLREHIAKSSAMQDRVFAYFRVKNVLQPNKSSKFSIDAVVSVIDHLIDMGLMIRGDGLWLFAIDLFEDPAKREVFKTITDDEVRMKWLCHKKNPGFYK